MHKESVHGLAHICVFTPDMGKSLDFYIGYLGFHKVYETRLERPEGKLLYVIVKCGDCVVELLEPETAHERGGAVLLDHFALEVMDSGAMRKRAAEFGVKVIVELFEIEELLGGIKGLFIEGPSGEKIELFEYRNKPCFL